MIAVATQLSIQDLYARYALGIDGADFGMVAGCFTSEATYAVAGVYSVRSRDLVMERIRTRHVPGRTHLTCNLLVSEQTHGGLRGRATFVVLGADGATEAVGEYEDVLASAQGDAWQFSERVITYRFSRARSEPPTGVITGA